ncbi:MAG: hypothetical protein ACYDAC_07175 [Candidatus Dormibacteria bacterium]
MTELTSRQHGDDDVLWSAAPDESGEVTGWRRFRDLVLAVVVGLLIVGAGVWNTLANGPIHPHI